MRGRSLSRVGLILVLVVLSATPALLAQSQATTGVIEGTVSDDSGAVLPGVTVTLLNTATNFEQVLVTDARGRYRGLLLPLGPYRVTAALEGFQTAIVNDVRLSVGQTQTVNFTLQLGAVEEEVVVTADRAQIEVSRTENSTTISRETLESVPNNGRNFLEFTKLTPGVSIVQGPDGDEADHQRPEGDPEQHLGGRCGLQQPVLR